LTNTQFFGFGRAGTRLVRVHMLALGTMWMGLSGKSKQDECELEVTMDKAPLNQNVNYQKKKVLNWVISTEVIEAYLYFNYVTT